MVLQHTGYREFEVEALDQGEAEGKAFELAEDPAPWDNTPEIIVWSAEEVEVES